jgi:hypothetical protein
MRAKAQRMRIAVIPMPPEASSLLPPPTFDPFTGVPGAAVGAALPEVGAAVGDTELVAVGTAVGVAFGMDVGASVGTFEELGPFVGGAEGPAVGASEGCVVGASVGVSVGVLVGALVGAAMGWRVGNSVGCSVGVLDGDGVVGAAVSGGVEYTIAVANPLPYKHPAMQNAGDNPPWSPVL